jgi:hypothetical protein
VADELFLALIGCGLLGTLVAAAVSAARAPVTPKPSPAAEDRARPEARAAAHVDRISAAELRRRLIEDLRRHQAVRRHIERGGGIRDREMASLLEAVERSERVTRQKLADVEVWLQAGV